MDSFLRCWLECEGAVCARVTRTRHDVINVVGSRDAPGYPAIIDTSNEATKKEMQLSTIYIGVVERCGLSTWTRNLCLGVISAAQKHTL